jgi:hypothetical protein
MLEGRAASRAPRGRGWRFGVVEGGVEEGIGSPEGRSAMGTATGASGSGVGMVAAESAIMFDVVIPKFSSSQLRVLEVNR